jgi:hypothetical protein
MKVWQFNQEMDRCHEQLINETVKFKYWFLNLELGEAIIFIAFVSICSILAIHVIFDKEDNKNEEYTGW